MLPGSFRENCRCQILSVSPHLKLTITVLFYIGGYSRQADIMEVAASPMNLSDLHPRLASRVSIYGMLKR